MNRLPHDASQNAADADKQASNKAEDSQEQADNKQDSQL
jgi:hypothetical protein